MIGFVLLAIFFSLASSRIIQDAPPGMILSRPGVYKLTPRDYFNQEMLIFRLWGAGGDGAIAGGGSGANLAVLVKTEQQTFQITVAEGGTMQETSVISPYTRLVVGSGSSAIGFHPGTEGIVLEDSGYEELITRIFGHNGGKRPDNKGDEGGNGGRPPYYGRIAEGSSANKSAENGTFPAGGGGGSMIGKPGLGADGLIIINSARIDDEIKYSFTIVLLSCFTTFIASASLVLFIGFAVQDCHERINKRTELPKSPEYSSDDSVAITMEMSCTTEESLCDEKPLNTTDGTPYTQIPQ